MGAAAESGGGAGGEGAGGVYDEAGDAAIWRRTRARQPLEHVSLEELEALLGECDDDELWPALEDEDAAYQQFLAVRPLPYQH